MLLKHLYDFAHSRGVLDDLAFAPKAVRWVIPLNRQGFLIGSGLIETPEEKKRGKEFLAPRTSLDKGIGGIAEFLADGVTAVFGLEADRDPKKPLSEKRRRDRDANNAKKHEHFWTQVRQAFADTGYPALNSLLTFHEQIKGQPPFIRYGKKAGSDDPEEKPKWWLATSTGSEERLGPDQFTFQVEGEMLLLNEQVIRPFWRNAYAAEMAEREKESPRGICLVTGREGMPIARTHLPLIKGVPGATAQDRKVISFEGDAFKSYGFPQSLNAPVSLEAVAAYTNALTWMLRREDHSLRIGGSAVCFWAKNDKGASGFISQMLHKPDTRAIAKFLEAPWAGAVDRRLAKQDQFYSVTLSGNAGRVVVRHWMQETLEQAIENFRRWFADLEMVEIRQAYDAAKTKRQKERPPGEEPKEQMPPLAIFRLACATVRDAKHIKADVHVLAQLYRAALEGTAPSLTLLQPLLQEFKSALVADTKKKPRFPFNPSRFALLRLILNRKRKEDAPVIEPKVFETDDAAYNSGRLLAILAETQAKAHEYKLEGPGVAERYFGAASVSPSSVFPLLLRLNRHHLEKISKSDRYRGHERYLKEEIQGITCKFTPIAPGKPPEFPHLLDLQQQGRFMIGFYQQKADIDTRKRKGGPAGAGQANTNGQ